MTDTRLKDCLDRWTGEMPQYLRGAAINNQFRSLNSIARICRQQYARDAGDHWKTPAETWADRRGDCEDIAILTAAVIKAALPATRIELVLAWKAGTRKGHALICAHGWTEPVYIDNEYRLPYAEAKFSERYEEHSRLGWPA